MSSSYLWVWQDWDDRVIGVDGGWQLDNALEVPVGYTTRRVFAYWSAAGRGASATIADPIAPSWHFGHCALAQYRASGDGNRVLHEWGASAAGPMTLVFDPSVGIGGYRWAATGSMGPWSVEMALRQTSSADDPLFLAWTAGVQTDTGTNEAYPTIPDWHYHMRIMALVAPTGS